MHEWSIAEGIIRTLVSYAKERGLRRLIEVEISVGELSMLDVGILEEALRMLSEEEKMLRGAKFTIKTKPVLFRCNICGSKWTLRDMKSSLEKEAQEYLLEDEEGGLDLPLHYMPDLVYAFARCPNCGSRDFEIEQGRELIVEKITSER